MKEGGCPVGEIPAVASLSWEWCCLSRCAIQKTGPVRCTSQCTALTVGAVNGILLRRSGVSTSNKLDTRLCWGLHFAMKVGAVNSNLSKRNGASTSAGTMLDTRLCWGLHVAMTVGAVKVTLP